MRQTNLTGESAEYVSAREELRQAEIELMRHRERVAEQRRRLPLGPVVDDYVFEEGPADLEAGDSPTRTVRLSELFTGPGRELVVYHLMYGKKQTEPCPMCTMWLDGLNGVAHHLARNVDFAVVAAAGLPALRAHARNREWTNLRLLGAGSSTFKYDLGSEDAEGRQDSTVSVFTRDDLTPPPAGGAGEGSAGAGGAGEGSVRHVYSVHPRMSDDIDQRGIDLLSPVWHVLDLTRGGRGDWFPALSY